MRKRLISLGRNLAVYGAGDVATSVISFLLLPLYVRYLSPEDYGVLSLLLTVEVGAKILFRWGVDASFMRLFYDCETDADRQRLTSTLFFFLLVVNGSLVALGLAMAPALSEHLFSDLSRAGLIRLVLLNTAVVGFYFLPFHVLRIKGASRRFVTLTVTRSFATLAMRLVLVVAAGLGVFGVVLADVLVTVLFSLLLWPWLRPLLRPVFSQRLLREALHFGLPRIPHGIAHQMIAIADRYWLTLFVSLRDIGLYSVGASFGLAMKLFLSAFEYAWAPFYFSLMREPDAKRTFSLVTTYGVGVLVLLWAGLSAIAPDIVRLMTTPDFAGAATVIPWIGLGVLFQGVYLLTSIGLNITKRTAYYPVATMSAAAVSVVSNLVLIPRYGFAGASWANAISYGTLAAVAMLLSQRLYPISYEWRRLALLITAGAVSWAAASAWPTSHWNALTGVLVTGTTVVVVFPLVLLVTGFLAPAELRHLKSVIHRLRPALACGTDRLPPSAGSEPASDDLLVHARPPLGENGEAPQP